MSTPSWAERTRAKQSSSKSSSTPPLTSTAPSTPPSTVLTHVRSDHEPLNGSIPDNPTSSPSPPAETMNVWQARRHELSKRYPAADQPLKDDHKILLSPPTIIDTSDWPAPSQDIKSESSKSDSTLKITNPKKIHWKPINADISHITPVPTNNPGAQRRNNKAIHSRPTTSKNQTNLNPASVKSTPQTDTNDLSCVVVDSSGQIDKDRIRDDLTRPTLNHPQPIELNHEPPNSQAGQVHSSLDSSSSHDAPAEPTPSTMTTTTKPGFIPRISPTIQPPTMELSAGPTTDTYIGNPATYALGESLLASSPQTSYELHVNAPQGNVWVNNPLVMSDGSSPVDLHSHNHLNRASSAAVVFDGNHLLDQPRSTYTSLQPSVTIDHKSEQPAPSRENCTNSSFRDAGSLTTDEKPNGTGTRKVWKGISETNAAVSNESGKESSRNRKNSNGRAWNGSATRGAGPTSLTRLSNNRVDDIHPLSSSQGPSSTPIWKTSSPPRRQSLRNGRGNGNGGKKGGGKSPSSASSNAYSRARAHSSTGPDRVRTFRDVDDVQNWYSPHPSYGHYPPAPSLVGPAYVAPKYFSPPPPQSPFGATPTSPPYAHSQHPTQPTSPGEQNSTTPHLPLNVIGNNYGGPTGHYNLAGPQHGYASGLAERGYSVDPGLYYGLNGYYPPPIDASRSSRSSSIHSLQPLASVPDMLHYHLPPKPAFAVFGNYHRPAPLLAYPYPLDPIQYYVLGQCEYYFSVENLVKDVFLRSHMDEEGWVKIETIATFNRIQSLSTDLELIRDVISLSAFLDVDKDRMLLRKKDGWADWILPIEPMAPTFHHQADSTPAIIDEGTGVSAGADEHQEGQMPVGELPDASELIVKEQPALESPSGTLPEQGSNGMLAQVEEVEETAVDELTKSFDPIITVSPKGAKRTMSIGFDPSTSRHRQSNRNSTTLKKPR